MYEREKDNENQGVEEGEGERNFDEMARRGNTGLVGWKEKRKRRQDVT